MEKWKGNICTCVNLMPVFAASCVCPCVIQGISIWEINQKGGCGECLMAMMCMCVGMSLNRTRIRKHYSIRGSCIADSLGYTCCFHSCLSTQEYLHVCSSKKLAT